MKKFFILIIFLALNVAGYTQVNGYAKVTTVLGPVLTVSNADETYDLFNAGEMVMIMQMQDNVIGSNTSNDNNFGNLAGIANAGRYEFATIAIVARVAGIADIITLTAPLSNTYNTGANSSVQIITFPTLGSPNYTTTGNITAIPWNGNIGGVVAFNVNGRLLLGHNITADNAGFRGGASDANNSTHAGCNSTTYFNATNVSYGNKGEGIYRVTNANYAAAMGRMINGGGGGNGHNGGGGGGSNYTAGGDGGMGYGCTTLSGGFGGTSLNANINGFRFFMGGGGGSGEANNNGNTRGGNGGGIIFIKATEIQTTGTGTRIISANGQAGNSVGNDGAGGGGAGGTVLTEVNTWNISPAALLNITANGGGGGNVGDGSRHGGGGGGGQGAAVFTSLVPMTNTTISTTNGVGGLNWAGGARAPGGGGTSNGGVITTGFVILPVKLISFSGSSVNAGTSLTWVTENEYDFGYFDIQFSSDGIDFVSIGKMMSKGNGRGEYNYIHSSSAANRYYRLKLVDDDGRSSYSKIIVLRNSREENNVLTIYPNPAVRNPVLNIRSVGAGSASVSILNMHGAVLAEEKLMVHQGDNPIVLQSVNKLASAVYNVRVIVNGKTSFTRLVIQK